MGQLTCGFGFGLITLAALVDTVDTVDNSDSGAGVGVGLVLTLIAGIGIIAAVVGAIVKRT